MPVLPNRPTVFVHVCPDPIYKVFLGNQENLCAIDVELLPTNLTSPLYPVQVIDGLQSGGGIDLIRLLQVPMDQVQASGEVTSIALVDRVAYLDYEYMEEMQANGEVTSISLVTQVGYVDYEYTESMQAGGEVTSIYLSPGLLVTYDNWPPDELQAGAEVTSIQLRTV